MLRRWGGGVTRNTVLEARKGRETDSPLGCWREGGQSPQPRGADGLLAPRPVHQARVTCHSHRTGAAPAPLRFVPSTYTWLGPAGPGWARLPPDPSSPAVAEGWGLSPAGWFWASHPLSGLLTGFWLGGTGGKWVGRSTPSFRLFLCLGLHLHSGCVCSVWP